MKRFEYHPHKVASLSIQHIGHDSLLSMYHPMDKFSEVYFMEMDQALRLEISLGVPRICLIRILRILFIHPPDYGWHASISWSIIPVNSPRKLDASKLQRIRIKEHSVRQPMELRWRI